MVLEYCRTAATLALMVSMTASAPAIASPRIRGEVLVQQVVLADGTPRYAVPIKVGSTTILAGLDTGSVGLRILPGVLKSSDVRPTSQPDSASFGQGVELSGVIGRAVVSVGGLQGRTTVELVEHVGCKDATPNCTARSIQISQYKVLGDHNPSEGFKAILGLGMADADLPNVFRSLSVRRWIIDLPRPGEAKSGRIVINPTNAEVAGFVSLPVVRPVPGPLVDLHDAVPGCLVDEVTREEVCGAIALDTGAPGIVVLSGEARGRGWGTGTLAMFDLPGAAGRVRVREEFTIGRRADASRLTFLPQDPGTTPVILSGVTLYFAYSVLYDPKHESVGFRARRPMPEGPFALAEAR